MLPCLAQWAQHAAGDKPPATGHQQPGDHKQNHRLSLGHAVAGMGLIHDCGGLHIELLFEADQSHVKPVVSRPRLEIDLNVTRFRSLAQRLHLLLQGIAIHRKSLLQLIALKGRTAALLLRSKSVEVIDGFLKQGRRPLQTGLGLDGIARARFKECPRHAHPGTQ